MANLKQTSITGSSGTTTLSVSGSSILMPSMSGSVDSGSAAQMYVDITPTAGLTMKLTQAGSFGSQNSPYTCLGAWSVGGNMINPRTSTSGTGFSNDSLLTAGGNDGSAMNETEEYNGASWSSGGNLIYSRWTQLTGTQNSAIAGGGATPTRLSCTEEYNGTSWSEGGAMISTRADGAFSGQQNAAVYFAGYVGGTSLSTNTEFYNGSSWIAGPATPSNSFGGQAQGTPGATTLLLGGTSPSAPTYGATNCAIDFNGTTYSAITPLMFCHAVGGGYGQSSDNMGVVGGCTHSTGGCKTEEWHGISWSILPDLPVANRYLGGGGNINGSGAGVFGGAPVESVTYNMTKVLIQPFTYDAAATTDSWSGGPNILTTRFNAGGTGTTSAGLIFGGGTPGPTMSALTEEYDGTSWSAGGALSIARYVFNGGAGTQNAALAAGGLNGWFNPITSTEEYNGSSWSPGGAMITGRGDGAITGTQNAGMFSGGGSSGAPNGATNVEEYNGSTWSTGTATNRASRGYGGAGTQNDTIIVGGYDGSYNSNVETFNGTSWTNVTNYPQVGYQVYVAGENSSNTLSFAGYNAPSGASKAAYKWNGSTWTTLPPAPIAIWGGGYGGTATSAFGVGGQTPTFLGCMQIFNTATDVCSTTPFCLATWSNGASTINSFCSSGAAGTGAAAVAFGGGGPANPGSATNLYNGTAWSSANSLITARNCIGGTGTSTAALGIGGILSPSIRTCNEEWDGTDWTTGGPLITQRVYIGTAGTQNAASGFGGEANNVGTSCHEQYNGTSWSTATALIASSAFMAGTGTQNAAVKMGGGHGGSSSTTETWNGSSWTTSGALNNARYMLGGAGTQSDAWALGGYNASSNVENFNGVTWSNFPSMPFGTDVNSGTGGASSTSVMSIGGNAVPSATQKLEYGFYCVGSWSSGANMATARGYLAGIAGGATANAHLVYGGCAPSRVGCTEAYDGTSWSGGGAMIIARPFAAGTGAQNAALVMAGQSNSDLSAVEEYDGSSWTAGGALIIARRYPAAGGTQNAGLMFGGNSPSTNNATEEYDGSAWAAGGTLITARYGLGGTGTQNAALAYGGGAPGNVTCNEEYNGSSWASGGAMLIGRISIGGGAGTVNTALAFSGYSPDITKATQYYNGETWSICAYTGVGSFYPASGGDGVSAIKAGGLTPAIIGNTEVFECVNPVNQGLYCFTKTL